jgi:hypothetical protein
MRYAIHITTRMSNFVTSKHLEQLFYFLDEGTVKGPIQIATLDLRHST